MKYINLFSILTTNFYMLMPLHYSCNFPQGDDDFYVTPEKELQMLNDTTGVFRAREFEELPYRASDFSLRSQLNAGVEMKIQNVISSNSRVNVVDAASAAASSIVLPND